MPSEILDENLKLTLKFGSYEEILVIKNVKTSFKGHELRESIRNVFNIDDFHLCTSNGVDIKLNKQILNGDKFCVYPKVLGGKGGFGSLLRAFGKQITKSTNRDACRDLSGRRIKTVNRDKKLKEFVEKEGELAKQREIERKEKREKRKAELNKKHMFHDPKYEEQKNKIQEDLQEALATALEKKPDEPTTSKNIVETTTTAAEKITEVIEKTKKEKAPATVEKFKDWMGIEISDESEEDEEPKVKKAKN